MLSLMRIIALKFYIYVFNLEYICIEDREVMNPERGHGDNGGLKVGSTFGMHGKNEEEGMRIGTRNSGRRGNIRLKM